jgi:hypothetical protein
LHYKLKMLSHDKCKKILSKNGVKYTDEEVKKIREFLYKLGEISFAEFKKTHKNESNYLYQGVNN